MSEVFKSFFRVLQAPAVDSTGHFPFLDRMESRYNRVPTTNSRSMRDKLQDQGLEKLKEESALGPMNAFNSCKLSDKRFWK